MNKSLELLGIGVGTLPPALKPIASIECGALYAYVRATKEVRAKKQTKAHAAKSLLRHQRALEAVLAHTDFLPAQPNLVFTDEDALRDFVAAEADLITEELRRFGDQRQYQVVISWPLDHALKQLPNTEHGALYRAALTEGRDKRAVGEAIRDGMTAWRASVINDITSRITAATTDVLTLPVESDDALFNGVMLVQKAEVQGLEDVLETIDAQYASALRIQLIGPLPACSFASIGMEGADKAKDQLAMQALGVRQGQSARSLRQAWLGKAKSTHPDRQEGDSVAMSGLNEAYHHLKSRLRQGKLPLPTDAQKPIIQRDPLLEGTRP
ncbi:MAG: GvpL/GvpF family gas vesicle protein [Parvularculaceae bacterium]|nr:GvpL/GvpF family gas vesicle protein [Parvularculaceae bacterium]